MKEKILFLYEHRVRELDPIVITKIMIDNLYRENYVKIANICFNRRISYVKYLPKILLVPFFHNRTDWEQYAYFFNECYDINPTIVNLHWEQVGSENSQDFLIPKDETSKKIYHVSWSNNFSSILKKEGRIDDELIWQIGNPKADLLTSYFWRTYIEKDDLKRVINIPKSSTLYLFIMSFSSAFVSDEYINSVEKKGGYKNFKRFVQLSRESLELSILEIKKLAKYLSDKNGYILMRPHPLTPISEIKKRVKDNKNIKVSRQFPLHEVIFNSDGVISWLSTGILDSYIYKKPSVILRPKELPNEYDLDFLKGFQFAKDAKDIYDILLNEKNLFTNEKLLEETVERMYGNLDGKNCLRLAEKIIELDKNVPNYTPTKRNKSLYYSTLLNAIVKDVPKNLLAKYFPKILPSDLEGRADDRLTIGLIKNLESKYSSTINLLLKEIQTSKKN